MYSSDYPPVSFCFLCSHCSKKWLLISLLLFWSNFWHKYCTAHFLQNDLLVMGHILSSCKPFNFKRNQKQVIACVFCVFRKNIILPFWPKMHCCICFYWWYVLYSYFPWITVLQLIARLYISFFQGSSSLQSNCAISEIGQYSICGQRPPWSTETDHGTRGRVHPCQVEDKRSTPSQLCSQASRKETQVQVRFSSHEMGLIVIYSTVVYTCCYVKRIFWRILDPFHWAFEYMKVEILCY